MRSPHLEELLAALFSATTGPACRPIAVVSSLLLQDGEPTGAGEQEGGDSR